MRPGRSTAPAWTLVAITLAGAAIGGAVLAKNLIDDARIGVVSVRPYVPDFEGKRGALNVMMARGDGQGMAILARDPLLRRSPIDPAETAYRAQRPFVSLVAWAISLGRPERVPLGIAVSSVLGAGFLTLGAALLLRRLGLNPWWGLGVGILPGAIAAVPNGGPETWGLGFAFLGLAAWPERPWVAAATFALGGLCRETYLLVPGALALWELTRRRVPWRLGAPFVAYGAWVVVVNARVGAWPWDTANAVISLPFAGFAKALSAWGEETLPNAIVIILFGTLLIPALLRPGALRVVTMAYIALGIVMSHHVYGRWENFSRALLPGFALGVVGLVQGWRAGAPRTTVPG